MGGGGGVELGGGGVEKKKCSVSLHANEVTKIWSVLLFKLLPPPPPRPPPPPPPCSITGAERKVGWVVVGGGWGVQQKIKH